MRAELLLTSFLLAAGVSAGLTCWIVKANWQWALDLPNERSLHANPVPRIGGLGLIVAIIAAGAAAQWMGYRWLWLDTALAGGLCAASLIDDKRSLPVSLRLLTHAGAAALCVGIAWMTGSGGNVYLPPWLWVPLAFLTLVAMSNFYNFMDGANGMAAGMAVIGFGTFALASSATQPALAALAMALAGAALGFLVFNWQGRIFLGDCGSVPVGFLAASLGLSGWLSGAWTLWFPALVFAPFITDATVTLLKRLLRGERVWQAHREHYYQRVVRMGVSHARLAQGEYSLMALCAAAALGLPEFGARGQALVFATMVLLLFIPMLLIDARWRRYVRQHPA